MNILFISPDDGINGKGGISTVTKNIYNEIISDNKIKIIIGVSRGNLNIYFSYFFLIKVIFKLIILKLFKKCDLIHLNVASKGSCYRKIIIALVGKLIKVPYVIHLHGGNFDKFYFNSNLKLLINNFFYNSVSTIVLGNYWKNFLHKQLNLNKDKIYILRNSSNKLIFKNKKIKKILKIAFFGEYSNRKGIFDISNSLSNINTKKKWVMNFYGSGEKDKLANSILKNKLTNLININDWVSNNEINNILLDTDILLVPSYAENLPMIIVEGMAAGCAIITTNVGSISEIVKHNFNGLVISPGNVLDLRRSIENLINDDDLREFLSINAIKYHEKNLELKKYIKNLKELWIQSLMIKNSEN